jgi:hypothetical protein
MYTDMINTGLHRVVKEASGSLIYNVVKQLVKK